ncbi:tetratricopeptide repeat protein [Advenella sp. WQ 585]|uniref:Ancillary SecYEG translocon subunit n=1 Tax=Advenella mandrilli TaxID=2800330 RepID=A0ABS1EH67_9BURK|nr:tetratricopeptide repeat protein [Advenella mandrilli]MBK1782351.1 tetratricopeptide repeat protein [Advenella mandrilli]
MAFDLEEQEKIDALRAWWDRWGTPIMSVVTVVMLAFLAWYGWQWYQSNQSRQALGYFEVIQSASVNDDKAAATRVHEASAILRKDYANTSYTGRAVLLAANFLANNNQPEAAQAQLEWLITQTDSFPELVPVARLGMASLLADQEKYDEALLQLANPPASFKALFLDRAGDVLVAQGKKQEAVQQWKLALEQPNLAPDFIRAVQLKLSVLGGE